MDIWSYREVKAGPRSTRQERPHDIEHLSPEGVVVKEGRLPLDEAAVETLMEFDQADRRSGCHQGA